MKSYNKRMKWYISIFVFLFLAGSAGAYENNNSDEMDTLRRAMIELDAIRPLITESQRVTDRQARFRFDYHCLINDFLIVKSGLRAAIYHVREQSYKPLCIDYGTAGQLGEQAKYLQMIAHELLMLNVLIDEAYSVANLQNRSRVNYAAVKADITSISDAIQQALISASEQPRVLPVLRGAYSQ